MIKKSVLLTALAIAGFAVTTSAQTVPNYVPTNGLVGWWPFNGNAIDESVNTNNGTVNGATLTTDRFGSVNSAYSFDGVNDKIIITNSPNFILYRNTWATGNITSNDNGFTFSAWIKAVGDSSQCIFSKRDYTDACSMITNTGGFDNSVRLHPNELHNIGNTNLLNGWHNIVVVWDLPILKSYIDGIRIDSTSSNLITTLANPSDFEIGYWDTNEPLNVYHHPFEGKLDDIGIWNRALTQQEITGLYNGNVCFQTITVTDTLLINTNLTGFNPVTYQNTIKIWPNPTNDHITIDNGNLANLTGHQIKISNALGQQVFQSAITQQQFYVDMSTWGGNGIYFVNLINAQGVTIETRKIVLQ